MVREFNGMDGPEQVYEFSLYYNRGFYRHCSGFSSIRSKAENKGQGKRRCQRLNGGCRELDTGGSFKQSLVRRYFNLSINYACLPVMGRNSYLQLQETEEMEKEGEMIC